MSGDTAGRTASGSDEKLEFPLPFPPFRAGVGGWHGGPVPPDHGKDKSEGPGGDQGGEEEIVSLQFQASLPRGRGTPAFRTIVSQFPVAAKREPGSGKNEAALAPPWKNMVIVEIQVPCAKPDTGARI